MPPSKSHHRNSSISSDGLFDSYFSGFTEEDFKKIDEAVAAAWDKENDVDGHGALIDGLNLNLLTEAEWAKLDTLPDIEQPVGDDEGLFDTSFVSELNLGTLTEEEFERLDTFISETYSGGGPSTATQTMRAKNFQSPLRQFRRQGFLSVTDLANPTWCEVQYDYGLRGKRSRPIEKRPATFKSAAGKIISVEQKVAQKNDVRTKQGLAIHKELQREIRAKELEVDITTKETQWASRIMNMMACLKELLYGPRNMTREMPVFGILHDEVVVGMIDELVVDCGSRKRKVKNETSKGRPKKRLSRSKSPDVNSDVLIESNDARSDCEEPKSMYTVHLRDAKTRKWPSIPDDQEALAGRLQLYMYLTLLENLITLEKPFDFDVLWRKLGIKPDAKLPTKFLVQAQLISDNEDSELISLNDLASSFYELIKDNTMHVSPFLELVYYLRLPQKNPRGKGVEQDITEKEPLALFEADAASLPARNGATPNEVGTPDRARLEHCLDGRVVSAKESPSSRHDNVDEEGIRRFPLIGKKTFVYNEKEMNRHISHVLEWWRGERPPKGVPIHLTTRCRACEYANDCEWRDAKALELRNSSGLARNKTLQNRLHAND